MLPDEPSSGEQTPRSWCGLSDDSTQQTVNDTQDTASPFSQTRRSLASSTPGPGAVHAPPVAKAEVGASRQATLAEEPPAESPQYLSACTDSEQPHAHVHAGRGAPGLAAARMLKATHCFMGWPVRWPCCWSMFGLAFFGSIVAVGQLLLPLEVDTSFDSFTKTDVESSITRSGFKAAMSARSEAARRLQAKPMYRIYDVFIAYELEGAREDGIFDANVLREVAAFERGLRDIRAWRDLCSLASPEHQRLCNLGYSFVNFALPTRPLRDDADSVIPSSITLDGRNRHPLPTEAVLHLVHRHGLGNLFLPREFDAAPFQSAGGGRQVPPVTLRSAFRFKLRCCTTLDSLEAQGEGVRRLEEQWEQFAADTLIPEIYKHADGGTSFSIFVTGTKIEHIEVLRELHGDLIRAAGSMAFVLLYMVIHMRSILLGVMGFVISFLALPLAYIVLTLLKGLQTAMSVASFLSLFIITGLGADVIFVYTDFWRESAQHEAADADRMRWTYLRAGKATLVTTTTTMLSFLANLASVLKALREFGVFMALCVMIVWVLISVLYVPVCLWDERTCRSRRRDRERRRPRRCGTRCLTRWAQLLKYFRVPLCVLPTAALVAALVFAMRNMTTVTEMPNLFPPTHNQNRGRAVMSSFFFSGDVFHVNLAAPPYVLPVCDGGYFAPGASYDCPFFWCEVEHKPPGVCQCHRRARTSCQANALHRFAGPAPLPSAAVLSQVIRDHLVSQPDASIGTATTQMQPVLFEEWILGEFEFEPQAEVSTSLRSGCGWEDMCFCGPYSCKLDDPWTGLTPIHTTAFNRSEPARRLQAPSPRASPTLAPTSRANVEVVFGIRVGRRAPFMGDLDEDSVWSFADDFDVRQPWAQRNVYHFCTAMPAELLVAERLCWMEGFYEFLREEGEPFPVRAGSFDSLLARYLTQGTTGHELSRNFLWLREGRLKAFYLSFQVDVRVAADAETVLTHYKPKWDGLIERYNQHASDFATGAFHTSSLWESAESVQALISSTTLTLSIVVGLSFCAMAAFTQNVILSLYIVVSTLGVLAGLAFCMIVLMDWAVGPIEVVALIVFIGYALDYSMHITHKYATAEELPELPETDVSTKLGQRLQRVVYAFRAIGGAILGSAATTIGSSVFLFFCTLTIFQKIGVVVALVTGLSVSVAMVPLPACILLLGPTNPGNNFATAWRAAHSARYYFGARIASVDSLLPHGDLDEHLGIMPASGRTSSMGAQGSEEREAGRSGGGTGVTRGHPKQPEFEEADLGVEARRELPISSGSTHASLGAATAAARPQR